VALIAAILGYGLKYFKFPFLPLVLGTILGYMLESIFRRALLMSNNDYTTFVRAPISAGMLFVACCSSRSRWFAPGMSIVAAGERRRRRCGVPSCGL